MIKITPDIVFIADKAKLAEIRNLNPDKYKFIKNNKYVIEKGILIGHSHRLTGTVRNGKVEFNGIDHIIYDWDNTHRSATVIYNDNWFFYRSLGTKVKFQNKRWWGGWWEANTDALHLDYDVVWNVSRTPLAHYIHLKPTPDNCTDCGYLGRTIDFDVATIGTWDGDKISYDESTNQYVSLLDSPFDFKYFYTNSKVVFWGGTHYESLVEEQ